MLGQRLAIFLLFYIKLDMTFIYVGLFFQREYLQFNIVPLDLLASFPSVFFIKIKTPQILVLSGKNRLFKSSCENNNLTTPPGEGK